MNLKPGDAACDSVCDELYHRCIKAGIDPLLDDRDERPGAKLAAMDLIGIPWQVVVGPRGLDNGVVELKRRKTGVTEELAPSGVVHRLQGR